MSGRPLIDLGPFLSPERVVALPGGLPKCDLLDALAERTLADVYERVGFERVAGAARS